MNLISVALKKKKTYHSTLGKRISRDNHLSTTLYTIDERKGFGQVVVVVVVSSACETSGTQ